MEAIGAFVKFQKVKTGRIVVFVKFQRKAFPLGLSLNKLNEVHEQILNVSGYRRATSGWSADAAKIPEIIRRHAWSVSPWATKPKRLPLPNIIFEIQTNVSKS